MFGAIILQFVLIFLNAVFASAEIAVISTNETKLQKMAERGDKRAKRLVKMTSQPARFLSTIQVAITLAGFLGSAFAADNFAGPLTNVLVKAGLPLPASFINSICVILRMCVDTTLLTNSRRFIPSTQFNLSTNCAHSVDKCIFQILHLMYFVLITSIREVY